MRELIAERFLVNSHTYLTSRHVIPNRVSCSQGIFRFCFPIGPIAYYTLYIH